MGDTKPPVFLGSEVLYHSNRARKGISGIHVHLRGRVFNLRINPGAVDSSYLLTLLLHLKHAIVDITGIGKAIIEGELQVSALSLHGCE